MIYLFSQIMISLALAAIVGATAGWLVHRARAGKQADQLKSVISRQHQQVNEAQTQVSILTDDFDDLKQYSESEISSLRQDNQKIPALNQNLEKSQLLVRQLMQQHKASLTELSSENAKLSLKAKQVTDREQAFTKLQAELDIERRRNQQLTSQSDVAAKSDTTEPYATEPSSQYTVSQTELPLVNTVEPDSESKLTAVTFKKNTVTQNVENTASHGNTEATASAHNNEPALVSDKLAIEGALTPSSAETEAELETLREQLAEAVPQIKPLQGSTSRVHNLTETTVDENHLEPLFTSVIQQDDLKQIFGIGPVTEKTLNKLGITAYSQLAELKQYDIEKIADALQIFPGRIERDNWVGGARAQLEEMLEDL